MSDRPNPDELLRRVTEDERKKSRGKLTVFFGASPGVGKTYSMLEAARSERDLARDVVVGIVETHGRYETGALVIGLELLPRRRVAHRGVILEEFDLDAALARRPGLVLVDELAHSNAPGSRHPKRWQDVDELLEAGIDVYTTVNVQHLESLNDVVAQITGVVVKETIPDSIFDRADDIRIIDLPSDELLERLQDGKVYAPEQANLAARNFFRKGNLIALRELALRRTAERVDAQMHLWKQAQQIEKAWPVTERLLVGVSPSPASARLVRAARRMAAGLHATWIAVYVETPAALRASEQDKEQLRQNLRLAEQLGAEIVTLRGQSAAEETRRFARSRNVTKVIVGKPTHPRWMDLFRLSFLEEMVRESEDIDIYVISGEEKSNVSASAPRWRASRPASGPGSRPGEARQVIGYVAASVIVAIVSAVAWLLFGRALLPDVVMTYLLGIVLVSMRFGFGPSIAATVLSVLTLDFLFVPPFFSFSVSDFQHVVTFAVMFVVAVVISSLTRRIHEQADTARSREMRTARLYAISRELAATRSLDEMRSSATKHLRDVFDAEVAVMLPDAAGRIAAGNGAPFSFTPDAADMGVAEWVWSHDRAAGLLTDTLPSSGSLFIPLRGSRDRVGVLGLRPLTENRISTPENRQMVETFAGQIATAFERARLADDAEIANFKMEAEKLRSSLLSSVSHDLRTPLTVLAGASATLISPDANLSPLAQRELLEMVHEEAIRLGRMVRNLLDMTRLDSGTITVRGEWQPVEEVVGSVLNRMEAQLGARPVKLNFPANLPLVCVDAVLMEQVFSNLLENAHKYSPPGAPITISASAQDGEVIVDVTDQGLGVPSEERSRIFEKFYRLPRDGTSVGAGLGLAICQAVIQAHHGRIWVEDRPADDANGREAAAESPARVSGSRFRFALPTAGAPPALSDAEA